MKYRTKRILRLQWEIVELYAITMCLIGGLFSLFSSNWQLTLLDDFLAIVIFIWFMRNGIRKSKTLYRVLKEE